MASVFQFYLVEKSFGNVIITQNGSGLQLENNQFFTLEG